MSLHLWGTDFRRGTPQLRAQLYLPPNERALPIRKILDLGFQDLVYLHTCNRIEFFTTARDHFTDTRELWVKLLESLGLSSEHYYQGYHLEGKSALRHLLRVACSLESLVVGEPQILGQLKEALHWIRANGLPVQPALENCFHLAFETAKLVRTETSLGEKSVSVVSLGIQHLQRMEGKLPLRSAVVVGRGDISRIWIQWIKQNRPQVQLLWVNRRLSLLSQYPESQYTKIMALSDFLGSPPEFDYLFTATSSQEPIFSREFFKRTLPAVFFDFAEPPDVIEPAMDSSYQVVRISDLRDEAKANLAGRFQSIAQAEFWIESSLRTFYLEQKQAPVLRDFSALEPKVMQVLTQAMSLLEQEMEFTPELTSKVRRWAEKLVKKNLHDSREHLREVLCHVADPQLSPPTL